MTSRSPPTLQTITVDEPSRRWPIAVHGARSLQAPSRHRRLRRPHRRHAHQPRLLLEAPPQQALRRQAVEWVPRGMTGTCRSTAATTPARAALVGTSPWMMAKAARSWAPTPTSSADSGRLPIGDVDHAAHLQSANLAPDDSVLDDDGRAGGDDVVDEAQVLGPRRKRRGRRRGHHGDQLASVERPHVDRQPERRGPSGRDVSATSDTRSSRSAPLRTAKTSRRAEPRAVVERRVEQHPGTVRPARPAAEQGGAEREGGGSQGRLRRAITHDGGQLRRQQPGPAIAGADRRDLVHLVARWRRGVTWRRACARRSAC